MKHIIITNPMAGKRNKNLKYAKIIKRVLKNNNIDSEIIISNFPGNVIEIVKDFSSKYNCRFYSVGGDGTLNEIVTGIINSKSEIVVIPAGTGNDFAKITNEFKSVRKIILNSINKDSTPVDVMKVNKSNYCINILSAGFDALVGKNVDKFKFIPFVSGKFKYNLSILYTLFINKNFKFKLRCNDDILKQHFTMVAISNGLYYGGGICPNNDAIIDDGILNVCTIDKTNLFDKILLLPYYKKGTHQNLKQVNFFKSSKINIVSNSKFPVNIDGEVFYTNKLNVRLIPKAINIVFTTKKQNIDFSS